MISALLDLFFPPLCDACGKPIPEGLNCLCMKCRLSLHRTNYHRLEHNPVERHFWGRLPFERATAFLHFSSGSLSRSLVHQLKYQNRPDIGRYLGELCARELLVNNFFEGIDLILAVPIHPKKMKLRRYNQAACIAEGVSKGSGIYFDSKCLRKQIHTESQTTKGRYERYENVIDSFVIHQSKALENCHLLLVDDVVTTGSTLEACGRSILNKVDCRISILALAATD